MRTISLISFTGRKDRECLAIRNGNLFLNANGRVRPIKPAQAVRRFRKWHDQLANDVADLDYSPQSMHTFLLALERALP